MVSGGFGVARYLPNGELDQSFGIGGLAPAGFAFDGDSGTAVAVQPAARSSGSAARGTPTFPPGGTFEFAVARFNPNGTLDASFGTGGKVSTEFFAPPLQGAQEFADAVLVQPDGKHLVAGGRGRPTTSPPPSRARSRADHPDRTRTLVSAPAGGRS